ncbi:phage head closure protein [Mangrovibacter plantisponsor]|uniref:SPP1 family predicted phage head-tail adaptor n=1 Tax=Mangrovibacter plantisponsor TaxID=451513 RepID=A0A317PIT6_9ENTR|nr:phage head closure protein [Mangrovibacter plantisponsor]PWV99411.1 SPP1 family predicted phage head-tail adaptor [Mangrovibacter plantisponsor]
MKNRQSQTSIDYQLPEPGELNRRVLLRQRTDIPADDYGNTPEYQNSQYAWAKVRQVSATVLHESAQTDSAVTHYFTVRYRAGLTSDYEVVYSGRVYAIRRCRDLNMARRYLLLECEELGAETPGDSMYG